MSLVVASFRVKRTRMWKKTFYFFVGLPSRIRFGAAGGVLTVERSRVHAKVIHPVFWWARRSIGKRGKSVGFDGFAFLEFPLISLSFPSRIWSFLLDGILGN